VRRVPAWSLVVVALLSLAAGIVAGRVPWREWTARPRGVFVGSKATAQATKSPLFIRPIDRTDPSEYAKLVAEGTWWRKCAWCSNGDDISIAQVKVVRSERLEKTLMPATTAHLVQVHVEGTWWKTSADVLVVLVPEFVQDDPGCRILRPAFVLNAYRLSYRIVNLGSRRNRYALMIRTEVGGNGEHPTGTSLYMGDDDGWGLHEVFQATTSMQHVPWGGPTWDQKALEFRDRGRALKDIVVTAHVERWHGHPDWNREDSSSTPGYYKELDEDRVSVFRWNGDHYEGKMNVGE